MKTQITIDNLKCGGCANTIKKTVNEYAGVHDVAVDIDLETIYIDAEESLDIISLKEKLKSIGYPEKGSLHGMEKLTTSAKSYVSCAIGKMTK